jgi:hypothetical protein
MDEPQFKRTPTGEGLVVPSRREYDAFVNAVAEAEEDGVDIAVLGERLAERVLAPASRIPAQVSARLSAGRKRPTAIMPWTKPVPARRATACAMAPNGLQEPRSARAPWSSLKAQARVRVGDVAATRPVT